MLNSCPTPMLQACIYATCAAEISRNLTAVPGQARIVSQGAGWVVVDKPAGVPVVHSTDNVIESCLTCVAQARGRMPALLDDDRALNMAGTDCASPRAGLLGMLGLRCSPVCIFVCMPSVHARARQTFRLWCRARGHFWLIAGAGRGGAAAADTPPGHMHERAGGAGPHAGVRGGLQPPAGCGWRLLRTPPAQAVPRAVSRCAASGSAAWRSIMGVLEVVLSMHLRHLPAAGSVYTIQSALNSLAHVLQRGPRFLCFCLKHVPGPSRHAGALGGGERAPPGLAGAHAAVWGGRPGAPALRAGRAELRARAPGARRGRRGLAGRGGVGGGGRAAHWRSANLYASLLCQCFVLHIQFVADAAGVAHQMRSAMSLTSIFRHAGW